MTITAPLFTAETAEELMNQRGYKKTANSNGTKGECYYFLKEVDKYISIHAFVNITLQQVQLDFVGMLDMGIKMMTEQIALGTNVFENFENALLKYLRICLDQNGEEITLKTAVSVPTSNEPVEEPEEETPKKEKVDIKTRKRKFWDEVMPVAKERGWTKERALQFYNYWTEENKKGTRFRRENESYFDINRRMATFDSLDNKRDMQRKSTVDKKVEVLNEQITKIVTLDPNKLF